MRNRQKHETVLKHEISIMEMPGNECQHVSRCSLNSDIPMATNEHTEEVLYERSNRNFLLLHGMLRLL